MSDSGAPSHRPGGVADRVYARLRQEIVNLSLPPGERITENAVAGRLDASRTPVRQALHQLRQDRLVEDAAGGGLQVAQLTSADVSQLCDLLALVDGYLYANAAVRCGSDSDVASSLTDLATRMVEAAERRDVDAWRQADATYHATVHALAQNPWAAEVSQETRARLHRFWVVSSDRQQRLVDCSEEHTELARAISRGDATAAAQLVDAHIKHMRESLLAMLEAAAPLLGTVRREK